MFNFCSLYSGSSGNSLLVETENTKLLIDAGVSSKKIETALRLKSLDLNKEQIAKGSWKDNKLYIIIGAKAAKTFFPNENYNDLIFKNNILFNKPAIVLPHPSPLNIKWFKDNPDFIKKRIIEIRKIINNTLNKN